MQMPLSLQQAVERELGGASAQEVRRAALALSRRYREKGAPDGESFLTSEAEMRAYAVFRMPGTYAALVRALELGCAAGLAPVRTLTDVGCGSGSALWAVRTVFPGLERAHLLEREAGMLALARRLFAGETGCAADFAQGDMRSAPLPPAELVTASYALGELRPEEAEALLPRLWEAAQGALLLVEPGTPEGHARLRRWASALRALGARVLAPCPAGTRDCPLGETDFCAFTARVERTRLHRFLKEGERGFEDESFAFLLAAREAGAPPPGRVLRRPRVHSGFVELTLCREGAVRPAKVTRRDPSFKRARKADDGDPWEET